MSKTGESDADPGIGRVEAFSDGVVAIIITIMVLELHAPEAEGWAALARLWPTFLAYLLSWTLVAIYWVNHHRLLGHARKVTNGLLWSNIVLLFWLSLVPFTTAYVGLHRFARPAVQLYLLSMIAPALSYSLLQRAVRKVSAATRESEGYHRATIRKGTISLLLYTAGIPLCFLSPWWGMGTIALVSALWFLPSSRVNAWFFAVGLK